MRGRPFALWCAVLAGCFHASAHECGDLVCPADSTCSSDHTRCVSPAALAACANLSENDMCTLEGAPGTCVGGGCELAFCGDGIREGLEQCDGDDLGSDDQGQAKNCTNALAYVTFYEPPGLRCAENCTYDFSQCKGFCGDGVVNGPELCDGAPPVGTCIGYGFDAGPLGCIADLCAPDTSSCATIGWKRVATTFTDNLRAAFAAGPHDLFVAGGSITGVGYHFDGRTWTQLSFGSVEPVRSLTGTGPSDVFAGTQSGAVLHWDGAAWSSTDGAVSKATITGMSAVAPNDVFAVATSGKIAHFDGTGWTAMTSPTTEDLAAVWARTSSDVWAVDGMNQPGVVPSILHYDGSQWTEITANNAPAGTVFGAVIGFAGLVYFADFPFGSQVGGLLSWDGGTFTQTSYTFTGFLELSIAANNTSLYVGQDEMIATLSPNGRELMRTSPYGVAQPDVRAMASDPQGHVWGACLGGAVLRASGTTWNSVTLGLPVGMPIAVWGSDRTHVFGVIGGRCLGYAGGEQWLDEGICGPAVLDAVWGTSASNVYAVGEAGAIIRSTTGGSAWTTLSSGSVEELRAIWGSGAGDIYAVGDAGTVLHSTSTTWTPVAVPATEALYAIWGSKASDVWAVGAKGRALHFDGAQWTAQTIGDGSDLHALWGAGASDVWAVGDAGTLLHYDGASWSAVSSGTSVALASLWGSGPRDVFAGGDAGVLLHFDGTQWAPLRVVDPVANSVGSYAITSLWGDGRYLFLGSQNEILERSAFPAGGCAATETACNDLVDDDCDFLVDCDDPDCRAAPECN